MSTVCTILKSWVWKSCILKLEETEYTLILLHTYLYTQFISVDQRKYCKSTALPVVIHAAPVIELEINCLQRHDKRL